MKLPCDIIQQKVFERLDGMIAGLPVYDYVDEGTAFPYCVIGEVMVTLDEKSTKTNAVTMNDMEIFVLSDARSFKEANDFASEIVRLLDSQPLDVSSGGFSETHREFVQATATREWNDVQIIRQIVVVYRWKVFQSIGV